jgi:arsenate reductase (thioredoxin)
MTNVLFVCVGNSGRSVLAEHLFRADAAGGHAARSAGSRPESRVEPRVVEVLGELGIDARAHVPQPLTDDLVDWADVVIAACDGACPVVPGKRYENWQLPDPWVMTLDEVRALRDDVHERVRALLATL